MQHHEATLKPERHQWTPRHHPLFPKPPERYPTYPEYLPAPADFPYIGEEAGVIPVVAKRGQLQVFTQGLLHNGSRNFVSQAKCTGSMHLPLRLLPKPQRDAAASRTPRSRGRA